MFHFNSLIINDCFAEKLENLFAPARRSWLRLNIPFYRYCNAVEEGGMGSPEETAENRISGIRWER